MPTPGIDEADYIKAFMVERPIEFSLAALIIVDMQYATGHRDVRTLGGQAPAERAVAVPGGVLHIDDDQRGARKIDRPLNHERLDIVRLVDTRCRHGGFSLGSVRPRIPWPRSA